MANYETRLDNLESKGIKYHREFANFIIKKMEEYDPNVVLILGDTDFIVSYLIFKGMKNRNCYLKVVAKEEHFQPMTAFHMISPNEILPFKEYDLVISFRTKRYEIPVFSEATNFILFPTIEVLHETAEEFYQDIGFHLSNKKFDSKKFNNAFPTEFNTVFYSA